MIVLEEKLRIWSDDGFIKPGDLNYLLLRLYQRIDGVLPRPARTFRRSFETDQYSASELLAYKMIGMKLDSLEARAARKAPPKSIRIPPQVFWELVEFFRFWQGDMPGSAEELNSFLFGHEYRLADLQGQGYSHCLDVRKDHTGTSGKFEHVPSGFLIFFSYTSSTIEDELETGP